jgi:hypothetical protein
MAGAEPVDSRRYPRKRVPMWVEGVFRPKGDRSRVYAFQTVAEDLGTSGMSLRVDRPLTPGQVLTLALDLPPHPQMTSLGRPWVSSELDYQPVNLLARVMWCARRDDGTHRVGVEFLQLGPGERHRFKAFLISVGLDNGSSPLYT